MNYDDLKSRLQELGVNLSIGTLLRYRRVGLLPEAKKSHGGRGRGPEIDFPVEALAEAYAARKLFDNEPRPKTETVVKARQIALEALEKGEIFALLADDQGVFPYDFQSRLFAMNWLKNRDFIRQGFKPGDNVIFAIGSKNGREIIEVKPDPGGRALKSVKEAVKYSKEAQERQKRSR